MNKLKLTLSILALTVSQIASAEYIVKVPLEVSMGGSLPNGTISFKAPAVEPVPELNAWEVFADENGLTKNWDAINWYNQSLSDIPSSPYPLSSVNMINFSKNNLTDISSLSNITSISILNVSDNNLTDLDMLSGVSEINTIFAQNNNISNLNGLLNLKNNASTINLSNNNLINLDGLSGLSKVNTLNVSGNNLENLNGISNLKVSKIIMDSTYSGLKLEKNSYFCLNHVAANIVGPFRLQVCESPLTDWQQVAFDTKNYMSWESAQQIDFTNINWSNQPIPALPITPYPVNDAVNINVKNIEIPDINVFSNVKITGKFSISITYNGPKMAANTRFCQENNSNIIYSTVGSAKKSQLCEAP